jgi:ethanolamine utilization protein EutP (predicted NTPase)
MITILAKQKIVLISKTDLPTNWVQLFQKRTSHTGFIICIIIIINKYQENTN